jgi:seryl-tRNA synthetase
VLLLQAALPAAEEAASAAAAAVEKLVNRVGNSVMEDVPVSRDERENKVVHQWGRCDTAGPARYFSHHQLLWMIDGYEPERGVATAGHRGYFLKGPGVLLNQALIMYGVQFLAKRSYTALQPPFFSERACARVRVLCVPMRVCACARECVHVPLCACV